MTELTTADLQTEIEAAWAAREAVGVDTKGPVRTAVDEVIRLIDAGKLRVAEKIDGTWTTRIERPP